MTTTPRPAIKAAIYARCSDVKQAEKELSIPAQLDAARSEAKRRGWEIVAEYVDAAQTGKNDDREQFQQMMKVARAKKPPFQRIIVWKLSRFMRNRYQSAIYKTQLRKVGVLVFSLNEPTEDTATGRLMEGIIEAFDEFYSDNLAEDTSRGMRKNASLGFHNGGVIPTGYRIKRTGTEDSPKNVLDPDPATSALVQRMFRMVLEGEGAGSIRRALNREGLKTARGRDWSVTTVLSILRNPVYTGTLTFGKKTERRKDGEIVEPVVVENAHPALVSDEDFRAVQALIAGRTRERIHPTTLGSDYLLSGLLYCTNCGHVLIGHPAKSGTIHYYWCATRMKCGPEACGGKLLNRDAAEQAVADRLRDTVLTEVHVAEILALTNAEIMTRGTTVAGETTAIEAQLAEAKKKLERLWASLENGTMDEDVLAPRIKQWRATVAELEAKRAKLADARPPEPILVDDAIIREHVLEMRRLLDHGSVAARRSFLRAWIKRIEVRERMLTIEYTFPAYPPGGGGDDLTSDGGAVVVGKKPRGKGGGASGAKGGSVNVANNPSTPANTYRGAGVLSGGQDGSRSVT